MLSDIPDSLQHLFSALQHNTGILLFAAAAFFVAMKLVEMVVPLRRRKRKAPSRLWLWQQRTRTPPQPESTLSEFSPGSFKARAVLNSAERSLHREIEQLLPAIFPAKARLLSQVSMVEFLYAPGRDDTRSILAKRVDFLIVDAGFQPLCAIEYQGDGHYGADAEAQRDAKRRDWQKRRALRLGNVPLVEIPARWDRQMVAGALGDITGRRPQNNADRRPDLPASV